MPAGTMGDGAEYPGWIPCGAKLDKTRPKFSIFKFLPDEIRLRSYYPADGGTEGAGQGRKSPCSKIYPLQNQWPRRWRDLRRQRQRGDMAAVLS